MIRIGYVICAFLLIAACSDNKETTKKPSSPRIKKYSSVESPSQNQVYNRGADISISVATSEEFPIDSIQVTVGDQTNVFTSSTFDVNLPTRKVGSWRIQLKAFSGDKSETHYRKVIILPENEPEQLTYTIENTFPHNTDDYTQGLLIKDGILYESTGQRGESAFKKKNLTTGEVIHAVNLPSNFFGEGLALLNDEFYQLTWTSGKGFVYNANMEQIRTFNYQVEGWGLTTIEDQLILTDETEKIYFMEPQSFTIQRELEVYDNNGKVDALNELEAIDGLIYANVYQEDIIVVVDPDTGEVLKKIDLSGLLTPEEAARADVLNGIAYDDATKRIYVTGKWWPKLFEVTFQPKTI
ncbi:glutaminyl-peptide cyclotransferase [Ekhidna sp.]|uniref:glutaminyl-peptide cyclotransferase n=1 Tax=Ekhidna sp. TaxID=2608089 RepID=UPI003BA9B40D